MIFILKKIRLILILLVIFIIPIIVVVFADNYYSDRTTMYIGKQIELTSTRMFQEVISNNVLNDIDINNLVYVHYNETASVSNVIINTKLVNQILLDANIVLSEIFYDHLEEYFVDLYDYGNFNCNNSDFMDIASIS